MSLGLAHRNRSSKLKPRLSVHRPTITIDTTSPYEAPTEVSSDNYAGSEAVDYKEYDSKPSRPSHGYPFVPASWPSMHDPSGQTRFTPMENGGSEMNSGVVTDLGTGSPDLAPDNPFAFTPGQLNKMFNPKSLPAFGKLGGLAGIEKGLRSMPPHTSESPVRKQSKWSSEEDALIIELRGSGMKWDDISKRLPGRSHISCRLRYQNYLERRSEWDEERKNRLARLHERFGETSHSV